MGSSVERLHRSQCGVCVTADNQKARGFQNVTIFIARHCLYLKFLKQSTFSHLNSSTGYVAMSKTTWRGASAKERCDTDEKNMVVKVVG